MHSLTITIGRNYSSTSAAAILKGAAPIRPLSTGNWAAFQSTIHDLLASWEGTVEQHNGIGTWDGVEEESAKFTLLTPFAFDSTMLRGIKHELAWLAKVYHQDAIALTVGESKLITPLVTPVDYSTLGSTFQHN